MGQFKDKVVVITGAGSGVGRAAALQFAGEGAQVVCVGRTRAKLDGTIALIRDAGGKALALAADIARDETADLVMDTVKRDFGGLDILVNNAGVGYSYESQSPGSMAVLADTPAAGWREVIDINLNGAALMSRAAIPLLLERGGGAIVIVASVMGLGGYPAAHAYSAAKAGLMNLTAALAVTYGPRNIRTNCVAPGAIDTEMIASVLATGILDSDEQRFALSPLGRAARPEEIADAITFLASAKASYINGAVLVVDGGSSAKSM